MPAIFAQADALLVSLCKGPAMSLTIPSKIQAYLAAGRPILAAMDGEGARVVEEAGAGMASAAEDAAALAAAARQLQSLNAEARQAMGVAGRRYYEEHFAPDTLARTLVAQFACAIKNRESAEK
jgi:glycosyltransferase involved in cell wall biosynthesis